MQDQPELKVSFCFRYVMRIYRFLERILRLKQSCIELLDVVDGEGTGLELFVT